MIACINDPEVDYDADYSAQELANFGFKFGNYSPEVIETLRLLRVHQVCLQGPYVIDESLLVPEWGDSSLHELTSLTKEELDKVQVFCIR